MTDTAIIGIGNLYRSDDAAGWAVIDSLDGRAPQGIALYKLHPDIGQMLGLFTEHSTLFLIDAWKGPKKGPAFVRFDPMKDGKLLRTSCTSTHGISVKSCIDLAEALSMLPKKIIIYAIRVENTTLSTSMTTEIQKTIEKVASTILEEPEVYQCMKKV
jgi:hydrogenase maturation protease